MQNAETVIVGLIILAAAIYLYRTFRPRGSKVGSGCGCGTTDCKVPKTKLKTK